ncbi:MAG: CRISPR-associated helicase Cas3' [Thiohalocapsa sp.]|nr:CRISPR-associated helicase Cas3' [Thiohalocapsa sp.]
MMGKQYFRYWGKAGNDGAFHLLPYHSLDVAACGWIFLERHTALRKELAARLGLDETTLMRWIAFMLALHDGGKFGHRFQNLRPDFPFLAKSPADAKRYHPRHDSLGLLLWYEVLEESVLKKFVSETSTSRATRRALSAWIGTAVGHHGQPPATPNGRPITDQFTPDDQHAAAAFCNDAGELILDGVQLEINDAKALEHTLKRLSWWLAGVAVLCDWLGSNAEIFRLVSHDMPIDVYWRDYALPGARRAIEMSGVVPLAASPRSQRELFGYLKTPTPLQKLAADIPVSSSPQLFILEDITGSGKTEAAFTLAHRVQMTGAADGIYLGLPTMATSNAMHRRIVDQGLHERLFAGEPAVVLTHAAARLMKKSEAREAVLPQAPREGDYTAGEPSAANLRAAWLGDHRKKALLADLGVGNIDQALLGVLPSRHQSLRLLGLARKVLIVDEVHAYDAYMQTLLATLLRFQAYIGGHAILLSATLPKSMRQALINAFRNGLSAEPSAVASDAYPMLTRVHSNGLEECPLTARPEIARCVDVQQISEESAAIGILLNAHRQGQCACWVRNTVDDAITAWRALRAADVPVDKIDLFHARFALGDRLRIEERVLTNFGPTSGLEQRQGRLLIATQVVEQSLDLDFDVMVTDLAPMDLIIQRAGRLQRHHRDRSGARRDQERRSPPCLHVLTPDPTEDADADWLGPLLPKTGKVYPDLRCLWRTARLLREHGAICMPEGARPLIEGVYGDRAQPAPTDIEMASTDADAASMNDKSMARFNALTLEQGYAADMDFWDDILAPTRLGDPSIRLRLARWQDGKLTPWCSKEDFEWAMSEVTIRATWFATDAEPADPALRQAISDYLETVYDKGRWSRLLPLRPAEGDSWVGEGIDARGRATCFCYDAMTGLMRIRED